MQIALLPVGTRGDVEPLLSLGKRLRARGHGVRFGSPPNHAPRVQAAGFPFHEVGVELQARLQQLELERLSKLRALKEIRALVLEAGKVEVGQALAACEGADVILGAGTGFGGFHAAQKLGVPYGFAFYAPGWIPSAAHAPTLMPFQGLPRFLNRLLWRLSQRQGDGLLLGPVNAARAELGLAPLKTLLESTAPRALLAYDPLFGPAPTDARAVLPAWPELELDHVGALQDDGAATLSPPLEAFLAGGPPPLFVGFGSMADSTPQRTAALLTSLSRTLDLRIVWALGWTAGRPVVDDPRLCCVDEAPFAALFPRCRLVVHHGGAGTVATALRAGVPQLVVPHLADQFFFGAKVAELGLGPAPVPRPKLTERALTGAVRAFLAAEGGFQERAREVKRQLPADPLGAAALRVEAWAERR